VSGTQLCPDCVDVFLKMELWSGKYGEPGRSDFAAKGSQEEALIVLPETLAAPVRK